MKSRTRTMQTSATLALLSTGGLVIAAYAGQSRKPTTGPEIFAKQCAKCHGAKGEGTKNYEKALTGLRSVGELTKYITASMPPGPKHCPATDAAKVAQFLYDEFYSPQAQAKHNPARISLSRLTVAQFRNSVADLLATFRPDGKIQESRGLHADYYKTGKLRTSDRVVQRVDPEVKFDFGDMGPTKDQNDPYQFSMRWEGSLIAPDSGEYEIIVRTDQAVELWLNDFKAPLIDALIKSGSDNEYRGSIHLLAGRAYPLKIDFSKGVQGVDNIANVKKKPPQKAFISLMWRRPHESAEVIPARCLTPVMARPTYVSTTAFPPDDRSVGYERGNSVSKAWDEAVTTAAIETATYVGDHLRELTNVGDAATDKDVRLRAWSGQFVERAFRQPLTPELQQTYIKHQFDGAGDPILATKRVVLLTLISPRFLYREPNVTAGNAYDTASRISYTLWDSIPDTDLLKAAAAGELKTKEQIENQINRMLTDPRAAAKVRNFFWLWLKVDNYPDLAKDSKNYPDFDDSVRADLRTSLELQIDGTVWNEKSDYRDLFLSSKVFLNGRLSKLYGGDLPAEAPFQALDIDKGERCGVLTHPYIMSSFAYINNSSPIHRGVMIVRNLLGRTLQPPPAAFVPLAADIQPNLTNRQRISLQTKPDACKGCHGIINPLGFTLEKFDAIGRERLTENNQPVDCSGGYQPASGAAAKFTGPKDLATYIANSPEAHTAFVQKFFQFLVGQPIRAYGEAALSKLQSKFEANNFNIKKLFADIVTAAATTEKSTISSSK
ncbi:MAG: DUF1592 domain-containing protein [Chthonomonadales bacterium]